MKTTFIQALVIAVLMLLPACGSEDPAANKNGPEAGGGSNAAGVAGIYDIDLSKLRGLVDAANKGLELKPDGTAILFVQEGPRRDLATGTWKLDGKKIAISVKNEVSESSMVGEYEPGMFWFSDPAVPGGKAEYKRR